MNEKIYACVLSSKDGEVPTTLKLAYGYDAGVKTAKKLASNHIAKIMEGQPDLDEFLLEIQNAKHLSDVVSVFNKIMLTALDRLETCYSAELIWDAE